MQRRGGGQIHELAAIGQGSVTAGAIGRSAGALLGAVGERGQCKSEWSSRRLYVSAASSTRTKILHAFGVALLTGNIKCGGTIPTTARVGAR